MAYKLGDIERGDKIGYRGFDKYIYQACVNCGKERWVRSEKGKPASHRCRKCSLLIANIKNPVHTSSAPKPEGWGKKARKRFIDARGYVKIRLNPQDFFYQMADCQGYVPEHRLVMARALGRCLHRWEIVHHKNNIKTDNGFKNLQLMSVLKHNQITIFETRIKYLEKRVTLLEAELELMKSLNREACLG